MPIRGFFTCVLLLSGCGGPAIVGASRHIAELRGCEPAQLTVQASVGAYLAAGCGEPSAYECDDRACRASGGDAAMDAERVATVRAQLEALDAEIAECSSGGETPVVQVYLDARGRPQGLALHPPHDAEVRGCIGALIVANVEVTGGAELLVAYPGGEAPEPPATPTPEAAPDTPAEVEPPAEEPVEPIDEGEDGEAALDPTPPDEAAP